jgi:hypothetical protein
VVALIKTPGSLIVGGSWWFAGFTHLCGFRGFTSGVDKSPQPPRSTIYSFGFHKL